MSPLLTHTAILLFSRTAPAEANAKNFFAIHSKKQNLQVAKWLYKHSLRIAQRSSLPWFLYTEMEQQGHSFGERIANAIEQVFAKGFQNVIVIGNDAPSLQAEDLKTAAALLHTTSMVLAPTAKGGVSLIGLSRASFRKEAFCAVSWQTENVFNELHLLTQSANLSFCTLPEKNDINDCTEAKKQLSALPKLHSFFFLYISLQASLAAFFQQQYYFLFSHGVHRFYGLRAPPFC